MAEFKTGGRPITTALIPVVDFAKGMRAAGSDKAFEANANLMTDINLPLYSGKDLPDDQRSQYPGGGSISVNLGKLTNMPENLLGAIGTTQKEPCTYSGNTPEETPITVDTYKRMSEQDPARRNCVRLTLDPQAIAAVNDIERDKGREAKGLPKLMTGDPKQDRKNPALGRLSVELKAVTTDQGVGAMNADRLKANLGEMAAQNYLMTTPGPTKARPDNSAAAAKYMPTKDDVDKVASLYAKEYAAFVDKYAEKGCDGIKPMKQGKDGTYSVDTKAKPIEGTKFASLKDMGFSPVHLDDGSVALVCTDGSKGAADTRKGPEGLRAFDEAFSKHMAQKVSQTFESGTVARNLGAQMGISSYPVTIPDSDMTVIQPSTTFEVKSFARALTTSVECATHNNQKPIEEIYGKTVLENTRAIQGYFPEKGGSEGRDKVLEEIRTKQPQATVSADYQRD